MSWDEFKYECMNDIIKMNNQEKKSMKDIQGVPKIFTHFDS